MPLATGRLLSAGQSAPQHLLNSLVPCLSVQWHRKPPSRMIRPNFERRHDAEADSHDIHLISE